LEATYIFPLPDRAAVTRLRMEAADRVVEGVVKAREEARAEYDAAISEGRRASIAEEERPGVFTLRVGNIMPGERVVVRTTLSGRLPFEDGQATFRFPLVVAPRYMPGKGLEGEQVGSGTAVDTDQVPDASRISPPILLPGFPNPVRLSIEVAVDPAGLPLAGLTSSLHGVSVEETDGGRYLVTLDPGARADRDFVLRLGYGDGSAVAATSLAIAWDEAPEGESEKLAHAGETADAASRAGTFLLTVLPPEPTGATRPRDVALVLDRSGSMEGWKMTAARRAAARIVDTLTAADRFTVLTFDHEITTPADLPSDALAAATDRHRFRAVQHLASVEARGGTEMMAPLEQAAALLAGDDAPDRDRVLVLVTDGQIGDEDAVLAALADRLATVRVHTVGVDSAVNAAFLQRLSALGGGHCELVESEDRLDEAMDAIHRRIGTPLVTDLGLTGFGDLELDHDSVTPTRLPDLFAGAPLVVAGRLSGRSRAESSSAEASPAVDIPSGIDVTGTAADGSAWSRRVSVIEISDAGLPQFWARGRIRDLEDRYVSTYEGLPEIEQAIIETSVGHSVLSRFTAFVAVDTRVVTKDGALKQVTQPVDAPDGWEMFDADETSALGGAIQPSMNRAKLARFAGPMSQAPGAPMAAPPPAPAGPGFGGAVPAAASAPMPAARDLLARLPDGVGSVRAEPAGDHIDLPDFLRETPKARSAPLSADDLRTFATTWLPRLTTAANDADEAQDEMLTEFTTALRALAPFFPAEHATRVAELLSTLTATDKPATERRKAAITFLESLAPRRRAPFWKR
jgi:Ca-activated chloride channel family protein